MQEIIEMLKTMQSLSNMDKDGDVFFCKEADFHDMIRTVLKRAEKLEAALESLTKKAFAAGFRAGAGDAGWFPERLDDYWKEYWKNEMPKV